jgi:hypothetical protein
MGQVALGLRSLVFRIVVFIVMATLLAWVLGGTLWPRPVSAIQRPVINAGGSQWGWRVTVNPTSLEVSYRLAERRNDTWEPVEGLEAFHAARPLVAPTGVLPSGVLFHVSVRGPSDQPTVLAIGAGGRVVKASD